MRSAADELDPLAPTGLEIALGVVSLLHVALAAFVLVRLFRRGQPMPHGVLGYVVLFFVPVVGPLLVLTWPGRVERHRERLDVSAG